MIRLVCFTLLVSMSAAALISDVQVEVKDFSKTAKKEEAALEAALQELKQFHIENYKVAERFPEEQLRKNLKMNLVMSMRKSTQFSKKFIAEGQVSDIYLMQIQLEGKGDNVIIKARHVRAFGNTVVPYKDEKYRTCKVIMYVNICSWKTRKVCREFVDFEIYEIGQVLSKRAKKELEGMDQIAQEINVV